MLSVGAQGPQVRRTGLFSLLTAAPSTSDLHCPDPGLSQREEDALGPQESGATVTAARQKG